MMMMKREERQSVRDTSTSHQFFVTRKQEQIQIAKKSFLPLTSKKSQILFTFYLIDKLIIVLINPTTFVAIITSLK